MMEEVTSTAAPVDQDQDQIKKLKATIQAFIDAHEHAGKGKARKEVMAALKEFNQTDFKTISEAYSKISSTIGKFTNTQHKKTPKVVNYLKGLSENLILQRQIEESQKQQRDEIEKIRREAQENARRLEEAQKAALEKPKQEAAAPVAAAAPEKQRRRKGSRAAKKSETTDSSAQLEKQLADEKQRVQILELELKRKSEQTQKQPANTALDAAEDKKRFQLMEEEIKESKRAAKKAQAELEAQTQAAEKLLAAKELEAKQRETELKLAAQQKLLAELDAAEAKRNADRDAAEAKRKADLEKQQKAHAEQLKQENAKTVDALGKATQAQEEKLKVAQTKFNEGYEKGTRDGEDNLALALVTEAKTDRELNNGLRRFAAKLPQLKAAAGQNSSTALIVSRDRFTRLDSVQSFNEMPSAQSRDSSSTFSPREQKPRTVITDKKTCMSILVQNRADLIGKAGKTAEEIKQNAITQAAIEYFVCELILRGKDKSMLEIRAQADEFMQLIGAGECPTLHELMFADEEKLTAEALSSEEANTFVGLLRLNPFGFDSTQVAKLFGDYADKKCNLADAEVRLKQIFIRSLEKPMIAAWLGTKYIVIKALVDLYENIKDLKDNESDIQRKQIRLAVFALVAHLRDKTTAQLLAVVQKLTALHPNVLKAIQENMDPNEKVSGNPLTVIDFQIFTALFAKAKFFVFSERKIAEYFFANGGVYAEEAHRKAAETSCIRALKEGLPEAKQQAPANTVPAQAMYKTEDPKKKAEVARAPLVETGMNSATTLDL